MAIKVQSFTGDSGHAYRQELARLRMRVFHEFPYLYDGTIENEERYLETFMQARDSLLVLAFDDEQIIGASTGMPLSEETAEVQQPWLDGGDPIDEIFYFSESVLLKEYRGQGIGLRFFEEREAWARQLGFKVTTFCGVLRPTDHPLRPADFVPLDAFWRKRGYHKKEGYVCRMSWQEIGGREETENVLQFWEKTL